MALSPVRRRFSQNFLVDRNYIERILEVIAPEPTDRILEIGPGRGALTRLLAARSEHVTVVEIDRDLAREIRSEIEEVEVVVGDVMRVDMEALFGVHLWRVVGNLPYHIATPLLFLLVRASARIHDMHFCLQDELVARICATPGNRQWGRLSVMMQYYAEVTPLFRIPATAFRPRPRVQSRMLRLVPRERPLCARSPKVLENLVRIAFSKRRKTLHNALKSYPRYDADALTRELGIDLKCRPETLGVDDFVAISNLLGDD